MDVSYVRRTRLAPRVALVLATLALGTLALTARADAVIYWTNGGPGNVGRADLDGTHVDQAFITGGHNTRGIDVDDTHIYWANWGQVNPTGAVGRANLDGTAVQQDFITGAIDPFGLAVDSAHIYWNDTDASSIGRANLDGTGVDLGFIPAVVDHSQVAVDETHIYWNHGYAIARANLDGTGVDPHFIDLVDDARGVAVDSEHVYWSASGLDSEAIGRANLDGSAVDEDFITGADAPAGVAVDASHVYWLNNGNSAIGRANLDGTGVDQSFITGTQLGSDLAVDNRRFPTADAGPDQTATVDASVRLDGGASTDANADPLTYTWSQVAGPSVGLGAADTARPEFAAPGAPATLEFQLEVCDPGRLCDRATTLVGVVDAADPPPKISGLEVSPRAFAVAPQKTPLARKAGAKIKLELSEDARVRFRVRRKTPRKGSDAPPKHPRVFKRSLAEGRNSVDFTGKLGKRTFKPGDYRLIARARDAGGQASERARTRFTITE